MNYRIKESDYIYIYDSGDESVGIPEVEWRLELPWLKEDYEIKDSDFLEKVREKFKWIYVDFCMGKCEVFFETELDRIENEYDKMEERNET